MKSSWRSPDGGSSVARNTKIESCGAVFCAWWGTGSTPIRSFHTVSLRASVKAQDVERTEAIDGQRTRHRQKSDRSQYRHLNLEPWLPDATEDDISLVSQTLLGLA